VATIPGGETRREISDPPCHDIPKLINFWREKSAGIWVLPSLELRAKKQTTAAATKTCNSRRQGRVADAEVIQS
jgi:hypothetical protein